MRACASLNVPRFDASSATNWPNLGEAKRRICPVKAITTHDNNGPAKKHIKIKYKLLMCFLIKFQIYYSWIS